MKKVLKHLFVLLLVVNSISLGFGCSQSQTTLPTATLSAMLEAAEAGDWEKYVDEYYGEQHKFKWRSSKQGYSMKGKLPTLRSRAEITLTFSPQNEIIESESFQSK